MASSRGNDALDQTVLFLAKRDGIDKVRPWIHQGIIPAAFAPLFTLVLIRLQTLKILRYTARLALATPLIDPSNKELRSKLLRLEGSLGTSRKAYRLGKFLQNVNAIRKVPLRAPHALLELLTNAGECIYYFVDQFQWYVSICELSRAYCFPQKSKAPS